MCGIFGIWNLDGCPVDLGRLRRGNDLQRHRGPDDEGYVLINTRTGRWLECGGPDTAGELQLPPLGSAAGGDFDLALAHRRLAILDLSAAGHQPMSNHDGLLWLIHNGEIYNYVELRDQLRGLGHSFRSDTDTEVILAAYRQWGLDCVTRFNGMWAFALFDMKQRRLFCSRDRFGIKPFHHAESAGTLTFASEIKALVGRHALPFVPNDDAICRFIAFGAFPSARTGETFFSNVQSIPPAHSLKISEEGKNLNRYYRVVIDEQDQPEPDEERTIEEFRDILLDAVRLRLRADVPVGSCLSGGLDSSTIVGAVHHLLSGNGGSPGHRQVTFSSVFEETARYNERPFVDQMLAHVPAEGVLVFPNFDDLEAELDDLVRHQDEPFGGLSIFAQWCVMRAAQQRGVKVLLDGQGADEILGGYGPFTTNVAGLLGTWQFGAAIREATAAPSPVRTFAAALSHLLPVNVQTVTRRPRRRRASSLTLLNPELRPQTADGVEEEVAEDRHDLSVALRYQLEETVLPALLRYEDRNSMAFGVEARVPFLDHRLVEFVFSIGPRLRIRQGWTKWLLRRSSKSLIPGSIAWRRDKVGFAVPDAAWVKQLVSAYPKIAHGSSVVAAYLSEMDVERYLIDSGRDASKAWPLWRSLNIDLWLKASGSSSPAVS